MPNVSYREATNQDILWLAKIRADNSETEEYWNNRISKYIAGDHNPQYALKPRIIYVATSNGLIIGFVAGHLSSRYDCEGELQWIDIIDVYRKGGIATELVKKLAYWFIKKAAYKVCVDPGNDIARLFYEKNGAENLNDHWMFWKDIRKIVRSSFI
jgi:GNAT superfamily N-acetyltransferase